MHLARVRPRVHRVRRQPLRAARPRILDPRHRCGGLGRRGLRRSLLVPTWFAVGLALAAVMVAVRCSRRLAGALRSCRLWRRSPVRAGASPSAAAGGSPSTRNALAISFSIAATDLLSAPVTIEIAMPLRPARPCGPMRWT